MLYNSEGLLIFLKISISHTEKVFPGLAECFPQSDLGSFSAVLHFFHHKVSRIGVSHRLPELGSTLASTWVGEVGGSVERTGPWQSGVCSNPGSATCFVTSATD